MRLIKGKSLLTRHNEHIARLKQNGVRLAEYACPSCGMTIEVIMPARGQVYDSMVECPHCEKMHFKIVDDSGSVETHVLHPITKKLQRGFSLVGLLASLMVYALFIGGIALMANALTPAPPTDASPRYTVTVYETRIDGQRVTCTETHDHQTGARERAC